MSNYNQISSFIWNVCDDVLRGMFKQHEYGDIILPFIVLRRLDCVMESNKDEVVKLYNEYKTKVDDPSLIIKSRIKSTFFNFSKYDLNRLKSDPQNINRNFQNYLGGFSDNVVDIIENFQLDKPIEKIKKNDRLYELIDKFTEINLHPDNVSNHEMGTIFEELLRRFSEMSNETSGEHYTPRDVVKLLVSILFSSDREELQKVGKVKSIFDPCCGSGGMLTVGKEYIHKNINSDLKLRLLGQELNSQTFSICKSDMLISGENPDDIRGPLSSLSEDKFQGERFDYMITNPPFGVSWKSEKEFVENEFSNPNGRFKHGLPWIKDGQLLFIQHMISKMEPSGSRIGLITNGSPLTTEGKSIDGESKIRDYLINNDLLETIIQLPDDLFFNTGILSYIWIITNKKPKDRKGKVQIINGLNYYKDLFKPIGDKRKVITREHIDIITDKYLNFRDEENSKIFKNNYFQFKEIKIYHPEIDDENKLVLNKKGEPKPDRTLTDSVKINILDDTNSFFSDYLNRNPNTWFKEDEIIYGSEFHITKHFFVPQRTKPSFTLLDDIQKLQENSEIFSFHKKNKSHERNFERVYLDEKWYGELPKNWKVESIDNLFTQRSTRVSSTEYSPLSVTKSGIVKQLDHVSKSSDTGNRKLVLKNDFVINSRSDRRGSSGLSEFDGSVSLINIVIFTKNLDPSYIHYLFRSKDFQEEFYRNGKGIVDDLWTTDYSEMRKIIIPVPPHEEQIEISKGLKKVHRFLNDQKELLNKYKLLEESLISELVLGKK